MARRSFNRYSLILLFLFIPTLLWAAPPTRIYDYNAGDPIDPSKVTANEDAIFNYLTRGVDTFASSLDTDDILDGTLTNADISGSAAIADSKLAQITTASKVSGAALTGLASIPSGAGDIPAANLNGVLLPSGAVFFMMTGSCPAGTTDVTATYSNKFIKINATQGTSSGVVLTGTSDSHTLTTDEMPSHSHVITTVNDLGSTNTGVPHGDANLQAQTPSTQTTGGGGGHTHTLSSATTLEPSSITCRLCSVN